MRAARALALTIALASTAPLHAPPAAAGNFDSLSAPAGALGDGGTELDPTMQTVRFGLNYKF